MKPSELFERCNETELYQIACASGLAVQPSTSKGQLIAYIVGEEVPQESAHEFDEWRLAIMGFVIEHRKRLEVQLRCPAKSMDPRACFQCVDEQVSSCLVENKQNLHLIRIHKKPIEKPTPEGATMATALNLQNAPRDKEKLTAAGAFQQRQLAEELEMFPVVMEGMAWVKLSLEGRADALLKRLLEIDGKSGAPQTNGAAVATADQPGASVPAVDAAAFKAAQDATAAGPGVASPGRRQPKEANGTAPTNGAAPTSSDAANILNAIQALTASMQEGKGLGTSIEAIEAKVQALSAAVAEQNKILTYALLMILTVAEERVSASRFDLLTNAASEAEILHAMLAEIGGAAKKAGKAA